MKALPSLVLALVFAACKLPKKAPAGQSDGGGGPGDPSANSAADAAPPLPAYVATLAAIAAAPGSQKPVKTRAVGGGRAADYVIDGLASATLTTVSGHPGQWLWTLPIDVLPVTLSPGRDLGAGLTNAPPAWQAIHGGPLDGELAQQNGSATLIESWEYAHAHMKGKEHAGLCAQGLVQTAPAVSDEAIHGGCEQTATSMLRAPSTAKTPGMFDDVERVSYTSDCEQVWHSWIEASNAFGVPIRNKYECTYSPKKGSFSVRMQ